MQDILNKIKDECKAQGINLVNGSLKNYSKGNRFELSEDLDYKDLISIIYSFSARMYGLRRKKNKNEILKFLEN